VADSVWTIVSRGVSLGFHRLATDPTGRRTIIATGACAAGVVSLLWSTSAIATQLLDRELFARRLGIGATATVFDPDAELSVADVRVLRDDPRTLVWCERSATVVTPDGQSLPVRLIATTPAYFSYRTASLRRGRTLHWADTLSWAPRVVVGAGLAATGAAAFSQLGVRPEVVGALNPRIGPNEDVIVVSLLHGANLEGQCGGDASRQLALLAPPPALSTVTRQVNQRLAMYRGMPAGVTAFRAALSPRAVTMWVGARLATRAALYGATILVTFAAAFTIVVLLEVRNHTRRFELGVARAVGATRRDLASELLAEASILSFAALTIGLVPAALTAWVLSAILDVSRPSLPALVGPGAIVAILTISATVWPLLQVSRQTPLHSLNADSW
jgi:hypothetical protein